MQRQKYFWNTLSTTGSGWNSTAGRTCPTRPVLLVGIHSGAPFVWDAWTVGVPWWRPFGEERPLHGTAHDALMAIPLIGRYFRAMGVLPAAPDSMATALAEGRDVAVWPGGEVDSLRPWTERDCANLAGRNGFVKMAIRAGVPIVPIATVGGADAMPVLIRGDGCRVRCGWIKCCGSRFFRWPCRCRGASHLLRYRNFRCPRRSARV